ncbi:site-2 protease family protein [Methanobrevibacter sp. TMH8]|uniref:site-2 protease family protein n=1 Tax=Methanobrevibacter sp. TMH8 TaxID=2848611 RepID=UPI001CCF2FD8|nr:site-2 protease family protein [Methanobrevibacter sp. TMH8]MBZ9569995.1 site-2 protease family protein [Methanobrevibacter sp. TMH8]
MFKFSSNEIRDLFISFFVISLAFSILYSRLDVTALINILPMVMVGVGLGFILHEIAHKITAMRYGYWAEYKTWTPGLFVALISSAFGFIFAAPGAVHIYGQYMTDRENGIISIAGPLTNILLSLIFLAVALWLGMTNPGLFSPIIASPEWVTILFETSMLGFSINAFLALFNLIPFSILDGAKIFRWNPLIWLSVAAVAGIMVYFSFTGVFF